MIEIALVVATLIAGLIAWFTHGRTARKQGAAEEAIEREALADTVETAIVEHDKPIEKKAQDDIDAIIRAEAAKLWGRPVTEAEADKRIEDIKRRNKT